MPLTSRFAGALAIILLLLFESACGGSSHVTGAAGKSGSATGSTTPAACVQAWNASASQWKDRNATVLTDTQFDTGYPHTKCLVIVDAEADSVMPCSTNRVLRYECFNHMAVKALLSATLLHWNAHIGSEGKLALGAVANSGTPTIGSEITDTRSRDCITSWNSYGASNPAVESVTVFQNGAGVFPVNDPPDTCQLEFFLASNQKHAFVVTGLLTRGVGDDVWTLGSPTPVPTADYNAANTVNVKDDGTLSYTLQRPQRAVASPAPEATPVTPTTESASASITKNTDCKSEAPTPPRTVSGPPTNQPISASDRHALRTAYAACHPAARPNGEALPGSVYDARYAGLDWAVATFPGAVAPEVFTRTAGTHRWRDDGNTLGQVCERLSGADGDGYALPATLSHLWRFSAVGHGCFTIPAPAGNGG